jgi:hypothetical protein
MNTDQKRKILVKCRQVGAYEYVCTPACELSFLACQLVRQDYLDGTQVKILELMGFEIIILEQENNYNGD